MPIEKSRILAQVNHYRSAKPKHFWAAAGIAGASMFGMVAAFGTASGTDTLQVTQQTVIEQLGTPQAALVATESSNLPFVREERILRGDTVAALLNRIGADDPAALSFLVTHDTARAIARQLSPGKTITAQIGDKGELLSLIFPLNGGKDQALFVERQNDGSFKATERGLELQTIVQIKSAEIRYTLFGATDAAGIPDAIATQLADIFGGDIDFHSDLRKGDRFSVVYETMLHQGKPVRTGRILAAEFVNNGSTYRAFWYGRGDTGGYYTAEGKNIRKAFLRSPLEFTRITSGFTTARFHPVLQTWRAHKGIDFGAPTGTKIKATADGVVDFAGKQNGYGNVIVLRHQGAYTTLYGHMSAFAAGMHKGARVSQGDVIGYVGATGMATGPHLHYEFRINGVHQNPMTIAMPSAPPLTAAQLPDFKAKTQAYLGQIEMTRGGNLALLN
ncbi:MAG TPA: peptidoglycan DD-metalloendopeptidase family protein [Rhodocyclaceae bacterium]|nr:peptidoglycan DD-metalloendopeptidase family protein [Rhodocyclaceae bacterium]